ncbi:MAG: O-antigen ligase family protein [Thermoleophilia bacterium]
MLALLMALLCLVGLAIGYNEKVQLLAVVAVLMVCVGFMAARYPWFAVGLPLFVFADIGIGVSTGIIIAGINLNLIDLLVIPALVPTVIRIAMGHRALVRPDLSVWLLLIVVGAATVFGFYYQNDPAVIRNEVHALMYIFLGFFWAGTELRTRKDLRNLLLLLIIVTAVAGLKAIVLSITGTVVGDQNLLQTADISSDQLGGTRTILAGGDTFFVTTVPLLAAIAIFYRRKTVFLWVLAAAVPISAGMLVSLTRTNWVASIVSALLVIVLAIRSRGLQSLKIATLIVISSAIAVMLVSALYPITDNYSFVDLIERRVSFDPNEGSGTLDYRIMEGKALLAVAQKHLLLGNGFGSRYSYIDYKGLMITNWSHNGFLFILLKAGIVGLALFLLAMIRTIMKSIIIAWRARDSLFAGVGLGMSMALLSLLLMSLLVNRISSLEGSYFIGLAMAVPVILAKMAGTDDAQAETARVT